LLAVAVVPAVAGISGDDYTDPVTFGSGFRAALLISSGLLVAGALVAFALIRRPLTTPEAGEIEAPPPTRVRLEKCMHCGISGPQVHPREPIGADQ
jgi:hypothetical protein